MKINYQTLRFGKTREKLKILKLVKNMILRIMKIFGV